MVDGALEQCAVAGGKARDLENDRGYKVLRCIVLSE
jgi:hypothetical protein